MSIEITLRYDSFEEAAALMVALAADDKAGKPAKQIKAAQTGEQSAAKTEAGAGTSQPATQAKATSIKTQPAASAGKATAQAPAPSPSPAPAPAASTSLRDKQYPETGIGDLINKYAAASKDNRTVAVQVLKALGGATKGTELKAEHYDAAHRAFSALVEGTAAETVLAGLAGGEEDGGLG